MTEGLSQDEQVTGTQHAPPERATEQEIEALAERALSDPILTVVFEAVGGVAMVLDKHRQIVAANDELLSILGVKTGDSILGLRPGEAVECVNADNEPGGCGTSRQCRHCGAVTAILAAQVSDRPIDGQCTITHWHDGSLRNTEFHVRVRPLDLGGERVYVIVLYDITAVKWREIQNRLFLHDMANMLTGLSGWSAELKDDPTGEAATQLIEMAQRLNAALQSHRLLLQCEAGELKLSPQRVIADVLTHSLQTLFGPLANKKHCNFVIVQVPGQLNLVTDIALLLRVLGNLITNAIEASQPNETVTITIYPKEGQTVFTVHNPGTIPEPTAGRLFKTRFSTKGPGRGLGMYSVQVFGEHYLGGHVDFKTSHETGTEFRFTMPSIPPIGTAPA